MQVFKPTRLLANGFLPTDAQKRQWEHDARPVIATANTCTDTGGYHKCAKTIEVDDAAMTLVQQKIAQCKDIQVHSDNKGRCTGMQLGHCCNAIDSSERMSPGEIIDTTLECAQNAYPCQLLEALHGTKHTVDLEQAQRKCAAAGVAAMNKKQFEIEMKAGAELMCQDGITDWDDTNQKAYHCCVVTAKEHADVHGHLPEIKDMVSSCHPMGLVDRWKYEAQRPWF